MTVKGAGMTGGIATLHGGGLRGWVCAGLSVYQVGYSGGFCVRGADVDKMWVERCYIALNRL